MPEESKTSVNTLVNVMPAAGGKVHKVVRHDRYTYEEIPASMVAAHPEVDWRIGRACDHEHNPYKPDYEGWYGRWIKALDGAPIDCGNCLKRYWPDGRKRV